MPDRRSIFRQEALERLSSPEQLDTLMQVVRPAGWLAAWTTVALLAAAVAWGFLGRIPIRVAGQGVLLESGGIAVVASPAAGEVEQLAVGVGDRVEEGQVIGSLAQPDLAQQLADARDRLDAARTQVAQEGALQEQDEALGARALDYQRAAAEAKLATLRGEVERLEHKVEVQKALVADGVITADTLAATRLDLGRARGEVIAGEAEVDRLEAEQAKARLTGDSDRRQRDSQVQDAEEQVALLAERLATSTRIVAAHAGRVVEVMSDVGELLQPGSPVVAIERQGAEGSRLQLIAYLSALDAYKVRSGMEVQVVPSVVKKEESGSLVGQVVSVADVPAATEDMMRLLGNRPLVERLATGGLPFEVRADLAADPATPSGYRWTSADGPRLKLHSGTLCDVSVVVRQQAPITLAIPGLEQALGL